MSSSLVNQILLNRFRVDAYVASGGMGVVYRVWDLKRNVHLAMKTLHADLADDPSIFRRFQREARALEKLAHPNIVPFYGLHQTEEFTFLLERFIDGPSLKQIIRNNKGQPLPINEALTCLKALGAALGYAHAHDVVHSDVKPGNVMVDQGGSIYLADFGIARHAESTVTTLGVAGSPAYMAPEQIRGEPVSPASDVYALGVLVYEMLTGTRPFRGDTEGTESSGATAAERIRYAQQYSRPPNPRELNPEIPEEAARALLKALEKSPSARYPSAQEFFQAVCAALGVAPGAIPDRLASQAASALPTVLGSTGVGQAPTTIVGQAAPTSPGARPLAGRFSRGAKLGLLAGFALILVVSMFFIIGQGGNGPTTTGGISGPDGIPEAFNSTPTPTSNPSGGTNAGQTGPNTSLGLSATPSKTPPPSPTKTRTPTPTPEGYDLAFTSNRDGQFSIYLMNSQNPASWTALPRPAGYEWVLWPTFCGDKIAVEAQDLDKSLPQWIYLINLTGQTDRFDPPNSPTALGVPRCSPDGEYISYSANQSGRWALTVASLSAGSQVVFDGSEMTITGYASWFANNRDFLWMAYTPQKTFITQATRNFQMANTNPVLPGETDSGKRIQQWRHPAISPAGDQFAFNCLLSDGSYICVADLNGTRARVLHPISRVEIEGYYDQVNPVWSADGNWIYFNSADDGDWDIYRIRPSGSGLENLTAAWRSQEFNPAIQWVSP
jgi:serine/threonine-protein kinase